MMKVIIVWLLSAFTCVLASPSCSQEEFAKCKEYEGPEDLSNLGPEATEESLELLCSTDSKVVDCQLDLMERCPNADFESKVPIEEAKRMYDILCDKSNPLRKKYLDNSRCMNEIMNDIWNTCNNGERVNTKEDEEGCMKLRKTLECAEKSVDETCGEDAKEAFRGIHNPEHQLRLNECV